MKSKPTITRHIYTLTEAMDVIARETADAFGEPLHHLRGDQRRDALQMMVDLGALELRNAVNQIARHFGISRVAVYNLLRL